MPGPRFLGAAFGLLLGCILFPAPALGATLGERAQALEDRAWEARARGRYTEAFDLTAKALESLLKEEWTGLDRDRAQASYLLALLRELTSLACMPEEALERLGALRAGAQAVQQEPALAAEVDLLRQELFETTFRPEQARALTGALGFLLDWQVLGPLDNERGRGFTQSWPPERAIDFATSLEGVKRPVSWRRVDASDATLGVIDLKALLRPDSQVLAYAATRVEAPEELDAVVRAGCGGSLAVWVNGELVHTSDARRPFFHDQVQAPVRLRKGANLVLVKVGTQNDPFRFAVRLCSPEGAPIEGLTCSADPGLFPSSIPEPPEVKPVAPRPAALDILQELHSREKEPRLAFWAAYLLSASKPFDENDRQDRSWARTAAEGEPDRAAYRFFLARTLTRQEGIAAEKDENPARRALEETLRLDPRHAEAFLALARYYRDGQHNHARALEAVDAALAVNPGFIEAGILKANMLAERESPVEQRLLLEGLFERPAGRHENRLARELARIAAGSGNPGKALTLEQEVLGRAASPEQALRVAGLLARAGRQAESQELLDRAARAWPFCAEILSARADHLLARGAKSAASTALAKILEFCPEDEAILVRLGHLAGESGDQELQITYFREALALNPGLEKVKRHLDFLLAEERPFYAELARSTESVLESAPPPPSDAKPNNDSHDYLLLHKVIRVNPDGTSSLYEHLIVRILTEAGASRFGSFSRTYFGGEQTARILQARVIHPDGSEDRARIGPAQLPMREVGRVRVNMPPSQVGSMVEISFRLDELKQSYFGDYFGHRHIFAAPDGALVHDSRLDVISPAGRILRTYSKNGAPEPDEMPLEGDRILRSWAISGVDRVVRESNMPEAHEFAPCVELSTFQDWNEFARWWWNLIRRQYDSSPEMTAKVRQLFEGARTESEKIRAVYNFVVTEVRYVAWEFGVHGYKPYNASTIFSRRHGDCKDKSILIGALLRHAGIEAWPVLIMGESRRSRDDLTLPLVDHFNHCIAYVPPVGDWPGGFLDGTASYHDAYTIPDMDRGARVVVVKGERAELMQVPWSDPESNVDFEEYVVRLSPPGDAEISFKGRPLENQAIYTRAAYGNEPGKRRENLENFFARRLGKVSVLDFRFSDLLDLDAPVEFEVEMSVREFAERRDGMLALKTGFSPARWTAIATSAERRHDIILINPWTDRHVVRYVLPPGWEPVELPPDAMAENSHAAFKVLWRMDGPNIVVETTRTLKAQRIPTNGYKEFRDLAGRLENAESQVVLIRPARRE